VTIKIAVAWDGTGWHVRFAAALDAKVAQGAPVQYEVVNLDRHDWLAAVAPFDVVIWKPAYMGQRMAAHFKEKVYVLEHFLGKLVVPSFDTVWGFESKVAQSYFFAARGIPTPNTFVSFDYADAVSALSQADLPLVFKKSHGGQSRNVQLVESRHQAESLVSTRLFQQRWEAARTLWRSSPLRALSSVFQRWFWVKAGQVVSGEERYGVVYWQDFVPGNSADVRILAVGDRFAMGYWRRNRPGDFRASGSELLDLERVIPENLVRYCLDMNKRFGFDSMAYDILFDQDRFLLTEMSFATVDYAIQQARGTFRLDDAGELSYRQGRVWPEELWVEWALIRAQRDLPGEKPGDL
jgi:glutathione synthase/RimK-type ligase-like ATP-grasp enzyme